MEPVAKWQSDSCCLCVIFAAANKVKGCHYSFYCGHYRLFVSPGCHCSWPWQSRCDWQMPREIRSSELRWVAVALNTPLQPSDVNHEMGQTFQMRKQLSLISHYECRLLRVSGFSSCCSWLCLARQFCRKRRSAKDIPLKPKEEPRREAEITANSLSAMLKIFPIMGAELDWPVAVEWGLRCKGWSHSHGHTSHSSSETIRLIVIVPKTCPLPLRVKLFLPQ